MGMLGRLFWLFAPKQYSRTELDRIGREFVLGEIRAAAHTLYGRDYHFASIRDYHDFVTRVPLVEYDDLSPYIQRSLAGEKMVLSNYPIDYFAKSAGSTAAVSKYLPVTGFSLKKNHRKVMKNLISTYLKNNPESRLLRGKSLILTWSFEKNPITQEDNIGFISAILHRSTPRYAQARRSGDDNHVTIKNREEKLYHIVTTAQYDDLVCIGGVWPWIVMLGEYTKKILGKTPREAWPNLELILSWAVNISIYKDQYAAIFGEDIRVYNVYNASEWFYAYQDRNDDHALALAAHHGIWYEFIPMDAYHGVYSQTVSLADIQANIDYAVVITNQSWLWRYINGDVIRFVDIENLRFHVVGRTKFFINTFDEKTSVDHTHKAIIHACKATNAVITEYTVWPKFLGEASRGMHERVIEFAQEPEDMDVFSTYLDQWLQEANSHYKGKRANDLLMLKPIVHTAPKGTFHAWFASKGKLWWQSKVPSVQNDRKVLEEIFTIMGKL